MIYLIQNDREYDYDVRAIALAFYERTKIVEVTKEEFEEQEWEKDDLLLTLVYTKKRIQGWLKGKVGIEGCEAKLKNWIPPLIRLPRSAKIVAELDFLYLFLILPFSLGICANSSHLK